MGTGRAVWRTGPNRSLTADHAGLRLVVQGPPEPAATAARFHILRREAGGERVMVGSGTEADLRAAMAAAEQMAERLAGWPPLGRD